MRSLSRQAVKTAACPGWSPDMLRGKWLYEVSRDRVALRLQCVISSVLLSAAGLKDALGRRDEGAGAVR